MLTIYKAEVSDEEGRGVSYFRFFTSYDLAEEYILKSKWYGCVKEVRVFDFSSDGATPNFSRSWEVSYLKHKEKQDKAKKEQLIKSALDKVGAILTAEEKEALGINVLSTT